jgi:hypothetical protein
MFMSTLLHASGIWCLELVYLVFVSLSGVHGRNGRLVGVNVQLNTRHLGRRLCGWDCIIIYFFGLCITH